jgi:hypothetical protein
MDKTTVLTVLGILVTATLGTLGYRIARARRAEEVEARRRADLSARLDPPGRPNYLVISCAGGTSARDVVVKLEPATILLEGEPMSFPSLVPGQEVRVHAAVTHDDFPAGAPRVVLVRLRWRDDRGSQAKDMSLTV